MAVFECAGAHHARFQCDIQSAVVKIFRAEGVASGGDSQHLRMGGDIMKHLHLIVSTSNNLAVNNNHRTDRHLVIFGSRHRLVQGLTHETLIRQSRNHNQNSLVYKRLPSVS